MHKERSSDNRFTTFFVVEASSFSSLVALFFVAGFSFTSSFGWAAIRVDRLPPVEACVVRGGIIEIEACGWYVVRVKWEKP